MRFVAGVVAAALIGLPSQMAMALCLGDYPNRICIYEHGVWTPAGFIPMPEKPAISKYPNASGAARSETAASPATSGQTVVLQPSAETGNAWVLTPQAGGGAVVQSP